MMWDFFCNCRIDSNEEEVTHPDHINADKDVDWIVVWDALEHAHIRIEPGLSRDFLRQR